MLEIKIGDKKTPGVVRAGGSVPKMLEELSLAIAAIHQQLRNSDPLMAEAFKMALQTGVAMEDGPVWGMKVHGIGMCFKAPGGGNDQV